MNVIQNWSNISEGDALVFNGQVEAGKSIKVWIPGVAPCINYVYDVTVERVGGGKITKTLTKTANAVTFTNMIAGDYRFYIRSMNSGSVFTMYQITYNY
ncbi:hypothetical protein [Laceyella tengchongensis]|uniref:hypothetical protein n=1 Tax=Laceyella tengchongensis TaxID=574699 RepID=UPI0012B9C8E0|nr:hypothetical protein [Laceyella tengchongensis]